MRGPGLYTCISLADDGIQIRTYHHPTLESFEMMVPCQLLAMEIAFRLGKRRGHAEEPGKKRDGLEGARSVPAGWVQDYGGRDAGMSEEYRG